jgi:hypothetical protein
MSQPKVFLNNTNISLGSDSSESVMKDRRNIVIGNQVSESPNANAPFLTKPRMTETIRSIVIGNGPLKGVEKNTTTEVTNGNTKIPDGALIFGNPPAIPCEANGTKANATDFHLIFGSGVEEDGLISDEATTATAQRGIPIWYNGRKYLLLAIYAP